MHGNAVGRNPRGDDATAGVASSGQLAYSVKHAARVVDVGERTMWQLVMDGVIESIKIGRSRRIPRAALVAYVERLREEAAK